MSIYVLDVQYITQNTENKITFPFEPSNNMLKQKREPKYGNNESDDTSSNVAKSLDTNRGSDKKRETNSVTISWSALKRNMNHKGHGKAVFFMYNNIENLFKSRENYLGSTEINDPKESDVLLSHIISVSLGRGHNSELEEPVIIEFRHIPNVSHSNPSGKPICVSWNTEIDTWSGSGCRLLKTNNDMSICECKHLASFALLLRNETSNPVFISEDVTNFSESISSHILIAEVITYIAVALSIILIVIILFKVSFGHVLNIYLKL